MTTVAAHATDGNLRFRNVVEPFLSQPGLPFADVLNAQTIEQTFRRYDGLFATNAIYATDVVLWAFLAQVLCDGKGAACSKAVEDIATYMGQIDACAPLGNTGDYCRARAKLHQAALRDLVRQGARQMEDQACADWLWHGRYAKLVDGTTFTMPDTPENQQAFPQLSTQEPGVGFPIARACVVLSLATGAVQDAAFGPYQGKETGETALLRSMLDSFKPGDVVVFDRYYCSYMMLAALQQRGVDVCARLHHRRAKDLRCGRKLGPSDYLVTWTRPARPAWMTAEEYQQIPETLTLRIIEFDVEAPGTGTERMTIVTTLIDPETYTREDIAELYGFRWNAELDIRAVKHPLSLDHLRCKTPEMIEREVWTTLLAYNLIRKVIATAAAVHGKQPRQISFTGTCQSVLSSWTLLATGRCYDPRQTVELALARIAAKRVGNRPGRIEPRVLKRRTQHYPLMQRPREELREELRRA